MTDTSTTVTVTTPDQVAEMLDTMPEDVARVFYGEDTPEETLVMVDELPSKRGRKGFWPGRLDRIRDNAPRWTNATETWQTKHRQSVIQAIGVTDDKDNFEVALRDGQVFVRYNATVTPVVADEPKTAFDYLNDDENLL